MNKYRAKFIWPALAIWIIQIDAHAGFNQDAKSMAITSSAKAQLNKERGRAGGGRQVQFLGKECKFEVAPLENLVKSKAVGQRSQVRVVVGDIIPVCEVHK